MICTIGCFFDFEYREDKHELNIILFIIIHIFSVDIHIYIYLDLMIKGQVLTFDSELVPFNIKSSSHYPFPIYDSLTYPAMLFDKPALNIFNSDFCRPVLIQYNGTVNMFGGINMHEYRVKFVDYDNCTNPNDTTTCNEVDKIDVSKCISASLPNGTLFLSKAHFYGSSQETMAEMNVEGFAPSADKHDSVVYFEPTTGTPFEATFRMQLNVEVTIDPMRQLDDGSELESANRKGVKRLVPVFWIDQEIKIHDKIIKKIKMLQFFLKHGQLILIPVAIVLSAIIVGIIEVIGRRGDKKYRKLHGGLH